MGQTFPNNSHQRRDYCPKTGFMAWSLMWESRRGNLRVREKLHTPKFLVATPDTKTLATKNCSELLHHWICQTCFHHLEIYNILSKHFFLLFKQKNFSLRKLTFVFTNGLQTPKEKSTLPNFFSHIDKHGRTQTVFRPRLRKIIEFCRTDVPINARSS